MSIQTTSKTTKMKRPEFQRLQSLVREINSVIHARNLYVQDPCLNYRIRVVNCRLIRDIITVESLNSGKDLSLAGLALFDGSGNAVKLSSDVRTSHNLSDLKP